VWSDNRLAIMRGTERIGTVGQVEPGFVATADIDVVVFAAEWTVRTPLPAARTYNAVGAYPAVRRDVAFVVDDAVTAGDIMATVRQASTDLVRNIDVFDVYRDKTVIGEGKKSLGITITVRSDERTLVDADVDAIVSAIISSVQSRHHATIRGAA
jgi:phenylalanyl-tRNA synthetase beta chain